ncbi:ABC transporter ATP-binding protein [Allohahella marinimesophila]|uniref:ABC transporter ATP-binding protein n=1 Tax=Allohahella marinimesophila TaxID=1054972 RepID=A0ABP7NVV1_9GAMM
MASSSFQALYSLIRYARGYRRQIITASICSAVNKLFDIAPEILIGIAIDVVVNQQSSFVAQLGVESPAMQITLLAVLTFLIWAGESIFEYAYLILWRNLAQQLQSDLRQDGYEHLQKLDMAYFESRSSGELISVLNDDVNQLERFLDGGANALIQVFVTVIAVGGVFFYISPMIALLAFTPIPVIIYGAFAFQKRAQPLYDDVRRRVGDLSSRLANNIGGIATIKSFTAEKREAAELRRISESYVASNRAAIRVSSAFIPIIRMAILAGFLATLVVGGMQALDGELGVGAYGVLVFLTQRLLWPLTSLAGTVDLYERAMASTRRILGLLDTPVTVVDSTRGEAVSFSVADDIRFNAVNFAYAQAAAPTLRDVDLTIEGGSTLALVGTTGSGKSTLIKLLLRFYDPSSGGITIGSHDIRQVSLQNLRDAIGLVSQDVFLFDGSLFENIAYARPDADREAVEQAARMAEAWSFISRLPEGLDTQIGERGVRLSGGQRQRISLARALLKDPAILILDEATSAVDNETEAAIQRSMVKIRQDRTLIIIAHRLSTVVDADRIVVLEDGKIMESGSHSQLLASNGAYYRQWRVQTGVHA